MTEITFVLCYPHSTLLNRIIFSQCLTITNETIVLEGQLAKGAVPIRRKEKRENIP